MKSYILRGKELATKPYHYTQCGLDDVYLMNGYHVHETPYGNGVSVEKADELQHAIAMSLCENKAFLSGTEFRFLRKLMNLTQAEVASYFLCNVQAVARWEKGKTELNGAADRLLRLLYIGSRRANVSPEEVIKALAELDAKADSQQIFEETADGWKTAA